MYSKGLKGWTKHLDFMLLDFIIMELAFIWSYSIRHPHRYVYNREEYRIGFFVLAMAVFLGGVVLRSYSDILKRDAAAEIISVVKLVVFVTVALLIYMFFGKTWQRFSRLNFIYFVLIAVTGVFIERILWKLILVRYRLSGKSHIRHMFIVTTASRASQVIDVIKKNSYGEINITGLALTDAPEDVGMTIDGIPVVCTVDGVVNYISKQWIDELMIYLPDGMDDPPEYLTRSCHLMGITTHTALRLGGNDSLIKTVENVAGIPSITESIRIVDGYQEIIKRIMDILGAIVGLIITGFLTVIIGPLIYISDPGPVFFSQDRIGKNGRIFRIYKFRSMYKDAEQRKAEFAGDNEMQGLMFKMENDPRIIGSGPDGKRHGIGWFIRKTSIDEFPQFLNVFKGDMSLVGTRPPTVDEWERYELRHRARLTIKPGLTGLWQAYGRSDITDFERILDMDMEYVNTWTIAGDIKIIARTVVSVLTSKGAK